MKTQLIVLGVTLSLACACRAAPDEDLLGKAAGYPPGNRLTAWSEPFRVGSFSGMDRIVPCTTVKRGKSVSAVDLAKNPPRIVYHFDGKELTVDDYLGRQRVTGLLILKDGEILLERYQYDRKASDRFLSNSMAKSIVSLAIGVAMQEGKIASLDDAAAKYEPKLAGCAYGDTSLRNLLHMSSGVKFTEVYDGKDDMARFGREAAAHGILSAIRLFTDRPIPQGQKFAYASIETAVLAAALKGAVGQSVSDYVSEKIWQPMGAESDAAWGTDGHGSELAYGYFNATLRDYARLGRLLANDGAIDGRQILPSDYIHEATDWRKQPAAFVPSKASAYYGYGYQFWLFPGETRRFALLGIYGQSIFIDPQIKLVMVQTAVAKEAVDLPMSRERDALWRAIVRTYGKW